jgi:two-component system, sensor histidine kinase ChiS
MPIKPIKYITAKISRKVPLRTVLVVPFVMQIFLAVGLVGYLSFRNGHKAVNNLATDLQEEISDRISLQLSDYLETPVQVSQLNVITNQLNILPLEDLDTVQSYFYQQMKIFDSLSYVNFGSEKGEFVGIGRENNGGLYLELATATYANVYNRYSLDETGNKKQFLAREQYNFQEDEWYIDAVKARKPIWSEIYQWDDDPKVIAVSLSSPVYSRDYQLIGVIGIDFILSEISKFLQALNISSSSKVFVLERDGMLVASSSLEQPYQSINGKLTRLNVFQSSDPLIRATANHLKDRFGDLNQIKTIETLEFKLKRDRHFIRVTPWQDELGLNWLVVVAMPESDFMAQINENTRDTILFSIAALFTAIYIGIVTSRWLTDPISELNAAATQLAQGEWEQRVELDRADELGQLANSFNLMAKQLQESFAILFETNEDLQRLDKLKDEFLANTSHELRTPLNGMIGIAESMIDGATGELTELQKQNLSIIVQSGHRLANLVNDILDFSKLRHQEIELQLKPINLHAIAEMVITLSTSLIGKKNLKLVNLINSDLTPVEADENRLQQIFYNLIGNAIKFTEKGTVKLSAQIIAAESQMQITVTDTGIGIPEAKFESIFESFEQADGSTARQYGGTGLGLTVTKKLVALHGGKVWVESTIGEGSRFIFTLPLSSEGAIQAQNPPVNIPLLQPEKVTEPEESEELEDEDLEHLEYLEDLENHSFFESDDKPEPPQNTGQVFKIMIVDDEPVNLQVLYNHLSLHNYAVTQAHDGIQALALLEHGYIPDLLLLDVMMPGMTGYQVCEQVRQHWSIAELPVMMLTAKSQVSDLVTGLEVGANDYLSKPFQKEELFARIKTHIAIKELRQEKAYIRKAFGRYVADEVADTLLSTPEGLKLGGERQVVTIFTSDLRGFTATSERLPSQEVVKILNFYFERMADIITEYQGTIIEFMGDGILVLFGAPVVREDDAIRAVACAVAMQLALVEVNKQMLAWDLPPLEMGIGINTGEVVVGNIGSEKRTKYGAVGSHVNLTYRVESYTTGGQIFIANSTYELVRSLVEIDEEKQVQPKGVKEPISIYSIAGIKDRYNLFLTKEIEQWFSLEQPIQIKYTILEGKHLGKNVFDGSIIELSAKGAKIYSYERREDDFPPELSNIKLNIPEKEASLSNTDTDTDIYGKVSALAENNLFYIRFTSLPPALKTKLDSLTALDKDLNKETPPK